jgi:hypothetical protein
VLAFAMVADRRRVSDIVIKLFDNAFSPFARKVRMVLEIQGAGF